MRILSYIYPNKLYPAIVKVNYVSAFPYKIYDFLYNEVENNGLGNYIPSLHKALEELGEFYKNLDLPSPKESDLQIYNAHIGKDFYIQRRTATEYYLYVGTDYGSDRKIILKDNISLEKVIDDGEKILAICEYEKRI